MRPAGALLTVAVLCVAASPAAAPLKPPAERQSPTLKTPASRPAPDDSPFGRARAVVEKPGAKPAGTIEPAGGDWGAFVRLKGPAFGRAERVVGLWYANDDTTQLPAVSTSLTLRRRLGPEELQIQIPVDPARSGSRGDFSGGRLHIVLQMPEGSTAVYAGTFTVGDAAASATTTVPAAPKPMAGPVKDDAIRGMRPEFKPQAITTAPIVLTGTRRPAFVSQTIKTEPILLTGTRRPPFAPQVIRTDPIVLTGTRRTLPALKSDSPIKLEPTPVEGGPIRPR